jgi:hypothetical protein
MSKKSTGEEDCTAEFYKSLKEELTLLLQSLQKNRRRRESSKFIL